jgi:hypothetical protein
METETEFFSQYGWKSRQLNRILSSIFLPDGEKPGPFPFSRLFRGHALVKLAPDRFNFYKCILPAL